MVAPTSSMLGGFGFTATMVVIAIRYLDWAYAKGGRYTTDMEAKYQTEFGSNRASGAWINPRVLVLACMLFKAFVAHYNAPRFFTPN